jgi:hypothetical protein
MYSSQIHRALMSDPHASQTFTGVFPSDLLPSNIEYPCSLVANIDPAAKPGSHWVAIVFDESGNAEYFDSYGFAPFVKSLFDYITSQLLLNRSSDIADVNDVQVQGVDSSACGHYCIAYIARRARGEPRTSIVKSFRGTKPGERDDDVINIVNKQFHITPRIQKGGGVGGIFSNSGNECCIVEQCCCSRLECLKRDKKCCT